MRYRAERDDTGVILKIHCPECRLTAWQHAKSPMLRVGDVPADDELLPFLEGMRDGCAERLRNAGCAHAMDDDAVDQLASLVKPLFVPPELPDLPEPSAPPES